MSEIRDYRALSSKVLAVATVTECVGEWRVYIEAVPGKNHELEAKLVASHGTKQPEELAKCLFPALARYRYAR